jgi:hypothetical protein
MRFSPLLRRVCFVIACVLVLALAWTGIHGGTGQLSDAATTGQKIQTYAQILYGVLSLLVIPTVFFARATVPVQLAWAAMLGVAGGFAPVVWGGAGIGIGLVAALSTLVVTAVLLWLLRTGAQGLRRHTSAEAFLE